MTEDIYRLIQTRRAEKERGEQLYNDRSGQRLCKICSNKVRTTMIGSLNAVEKKFGFLWGLDDDGNDSGKPLTKDQLFMKQLFDQLRTEILDNGNKQIRNLETELSQYTITWNRYHIDLPVIPEGPKGDSNER